MLISRSCRITSQNRILSVEVLIAVRSNNQRVYPATPIPGSSVGEFQLSSCTNKYPNFAWIRWLGIEGHVLHPEIIIESDLSLLFPPAIGSYGLEVYLPVGNQLQVEIIAPNWSIRNA